MLLCNTECTVCRSLIRLSFNPCFSGCCSATAVEYQKSLQEELVSILVLVDVALQRTRHTGILGEHVSFNPCFSGCCSATMCSSLRHVLYISVSILVLVDVALQLSRDCWLEEEKYSFNPCFSGCCSATSPAATILLLGFCFNPCFSGCCSATGEDTEDNLTYLWFQSLF